MQRSFLTGLLRVGGKKSCQDERKEHKKSPPLNLQREAIPKTDFSTIFIVYAFAKTETISCNNGFDNSRITWTRRQLLPDICAGRHRGLQLYILMKQIYFFTLQFLYPLQGIYGCRSFQTTCTRIVRRLSSLVSSIEPKS